MIMISIFLHVLLLLIILNQPVSVKPANIHKSKRDKVILSYISLSSPKPKTVVTVNPVVIDKKVLIKKNIDGKITATKKTITKPRKKPRVLIPPSPKSSMTNEPQTPSVNNEQTDNTEQPNKQITMSEQFRKKLNEQLRKAPPRHDVNDQFRSLMFSKNETKAKKQYEFETKQPIPIKKETFFDIKSDGADMLYNERFTVVNGRCYKVTNAKAMNPLALDGDLWTNSSGCNLKDKVKQQLNSSLNKFIGHRKK